MIRALIAGLLLVLLPSAAQAEERSTIHFASRAICLDQTGPMRGWQVRKAVEIWNAAGGATFTVSPYCDPALPRVVMWEVDLVNDIGGRTEYPEGLWWEGNVFTPTRVDVYLNRHYFGSRCRNLYITVHELGHALGLPHNESRWSPMSYVYEVEMRCGRLSRADVRAVRALYAGVPQ